MMPSLKSKRRFGLGTLSSRAAKQPLLFILIAFVCVSSCAFAYVSISYLLEDSRYLYLLAFDRWEPPWLGLFIFFITVITCIVATVSSVVVIATLGRRFNLYRDHDFITNEQSVEDSHGIVGVTGGDRCAVCGRPMTLVKDSMSRSDFMTGTQGCYRCRACGQLTCYDCSDSRKPCKCGAQQWSACFYLIR